MKIKGEKMENINYDEFKKNRKVKCEIYNDNFQNSKRYGIKKASEEMLVFEKTLFD